MTKYCPTSSETRFSQSSEDVILQMSLSDVLDKRSYCYLRFQASMIGHDVPIKTLRCSLCPAQSSINSRSYRHWGHRLHLTNTHVRFGGISVPGPVPVRPNALSEDYWIPPGELSEINRTAGLHDLENIYRCFGCKEPDCQVFLLHLLMHPRLVTWHLTNSCAVT